MTERSGVEIDYCPQCRGVWLDRGELDKIIEKNGTIAQSQRNGSHRDDHDDDDDDRAKKGGFNLGGQNMSHRRERENPLMDLFDF